MKVPWFDLAAIAILLWFVIRTAWIGFFRGLSSLAGLILGFVYAGNLAPRIKDILAPWFKGYPWLEAVSWILGFLIIFLGMFILAEILTRIFESAHLSGLNRLLGALLGLVKACVFLSVLLFFLVSFYPRTSEIIKNSRVMPLVLRTTRILIELIPPELKHRFNYHWRRYFGPPGKAI
ncbi:MAG TPA: CvpA family protein [Thermosulfurimonas dismutans]|uniref:CvpA family protein n=1 Tax=Thermosulfurimonas dismutans TaxID=999894 RepID=A0A7C3GRA6_9BACT|nr:CvpA family protein [Thermosulfurimonas dismutans]